MTFQQAVRWIKDNVPKDQMGRWTPEQAVTFMIAYEEATQYINDGMYAELADLIANGCKPMTEEYANESLQEFNDVGAISRLKELFRL